jgi:hypothetical protein
MPCLEVHCVYEYSESCERWDTQTCYLDWQTWLQKWSAHDYWHSPERAEVYYIRKFTQLNAPNASILDSCSEETRLFNPQILTATFGAANAGIDDPEVFGVCWTEFPPPVYSMSNKRKDEWDATRRPMLPPIGTCSAFCWKALWFYWNDYKIRQWKTILIFKHKKRISDRL